MRIANGLTLLLVIALSFTTVSAANAQDLLAWWSFNNTNNDSDLLNINGDDNSRANFGHMLDINDPFDDGYYDGASTLFPVSDTFSIDPGALIGAGARDPGLGAMPAAGNYGASINVSGLTGDNFAGTTSNNWGSFSGTGDNRPDGGAFGGGSLAITGDGNNGSSFQIEADLTNITDVDVTWVNRGTSSGFDSRIVEVSTDGVNFTQIYGDAGDLTSTWTLETADAGSLLDNASSAIIRFTLNGATSGSGNNRFDNIQLVGTVVPEPASAALALLAVVGLGLRRRS